MDKVALVKINSFASTATRTDIVPPDDPIFEIPFSELQGLLNEMVAGCFNRQFKCGRNGENSPYGISNLFIEK